MGLKIVYGKAGTGKSEFIFNEIKNKINGNEKIYIITPEQFSFTAEKKLLQAVGNNAVINAEVLTFERMAYRVINEVGGVTKVNLSESGKAMLIYNILETEKSKLKFLGKSDKNIEIVSKTITELKKHNINLENLQETIEKTEDLYLKTKLQDIYLLYKNFQDKIQKNYIDENDILTILSKQIEKTEIFKNTLIYIDEFAGFTPQEYEIIKKLLKSAKEITITMCTDSIIESTSPETDIFYSNKITISKLLKLQENEKITPIYLKERYRFKSEELKHLEQNIYSVPYKKYEKEIKNLNLFLALNQYSEIENVAKNIIKLVRDEKYRYNEIAIITKNIEQYSKIIKAIFNKYEIPVFIDEKKELSQNILVKYIISLLEIFSKNWSYDSVINYIKSGFLEISEHEIFELENYCTSCGIKQSKWYKEDWKYGNHSEEFIKKMNELRKKIVTPLVKFKQKFIGLKNFEEITKALYDFLIENNINIKLQNKIEELEKLEQKELADEYLASWDILINLFDEIVMVFGKENITFEKYEEILKVGLNNSSLGSIPQNIDQIIVGDVDRSRSHKVKAMFIIGMNDGSFPSINKNEGFLNDKDRKILKENEIELAKVMEEKIYDDNFNIYKAMSTAEEKLFLSYSSVDEEGKTLRASIIITKIKQIFSKIIEKSDVIEKELLITTKQIIFDELLLNIRNFIDDKKIDPIWFEIYNIYKNDENWKYKLQDAIKALNYTNIPQNINSETIQKLYGETLKTSISRLEQYRSCPFSFYLKYTLKLSEKSLFQIQSLDTGSFMHEVIDEFFTIVNNKNIKLKEITEEEIEKIINEIIQEKLLEKKNYIFQSTAKYKLLVERLRRLILKSMKYIILTITSGDFELFGNEIEFKENAKYPPIKLELDNGKTVEITGKIDRVDIAKNADGKYVRIIDYKSSVKDIDLNKVISGLQIQLLTYLDAITEIEDVLPAGVFYFNLIEPIIKAKKNETDEEIEDKIKKMFKMNGLILADVNVVRLMDRNLEKGYSDVVPAYITKEDTISEKLSNSVTKEEFHKLQKNVKRTIKEISKEILSGNINLKPYNKKRKTPCDYCEYKSICQFDTSLCNNEYNYLTENKKEEILNKLS